MEKYGMVIDLVKCTGCMSCVVACKAEHNAPNGILQTFVLEKELGRFPDVNRIMFPVLCNHCEEPTCVDVCPTGASYQRDDGIVAIDYHKCIGCLACIEHCPYHVRVLVTDDRMLYADGKTAFERPVHQKMIKNAVTKCDFCYHRVEKGQPPACAQICPTQARIFGDLTDQASEVSRLIREKKGWQLLAEKGTKPRVFYIGSTD